MDKIFVLIGSHSARFVSLNAANGQLEWEFNASDRIESSANITKCGNFVVFGNICILFVKKKIGKIKNKTFQEAMIRISTF